MVKSPETNHDWIRTLISSIRVAANSRRLQTVLSIALSIAVIMSLVWSNIEFWNDIE